ncbi:MAG: YkgJ family cysteine cluster protein [Candidatus Brocadiaceae bacterium]|nr:YkgJ family cysteine cluster protein [Candidatus Brocadiaceae bacterium]
MTIKKPLRERFSAELLTIYQQLDEEVAREKPMCRGCGTCCNFDTFDHVLYASKIEVDFILRNAKVPNFDISDNKCPFLKDNHCSIREYRTLGCRIFYCDASFREASHVLYEKYLRLLKELGEKYQVEWNYASFLHQLSPTYVTPR